MERNWVLYSGHYTNLSLLKADAIWCDARYSSLPHVDLKVIECTAQPSIPTTPQKYSSACESTTIVILRLWALCRVMMFTMHMVFLLPVVRAINFMSLLCLMPRPKVSYAPWHLPCLVSTCVSDASTRLISSASGSRPCLLNRLSYIIFSLLVNLIKARRWFNHWLCF